MRRIIAIPILAFIFVFNRETKAEEPRNLLQNAATLQQVKEALLPLPEWIKYPAYADRAQWDLLLGKLKEGIVKQGESKLQYTWQVVKATDYLEYERSGSRQVMEKPFGDNNTALSQLIMAELAEGKGRFTDQIINGVWYACDMPSWVLSAHLPVQKTRRNLPDPAEHIIDLTSGDVGSLLSWALYFFRQEWDKVNPVISRRLEQAIRERILQPYMARSDYWWQALQDKPGQLVNNWNPWCNFNVLTCFLLIEKNKDSLAAAVYRTMQSTDKFINYVKEDGACEEGPSYWGHAAGKLYDYLQLLSYATAGRISIFDKPMIKDMGEYISRSYVGKGWVVNFADASAKGGGDAGLIYRYGKAVSSTEMQSFAAQLLANGHKDNIQAGRDFFRTLENIRFHPELQQAKPAMPSAMYTWYPQTQFCYMKTNSGFFFAAKGGFNNESHNHNDVGSFSLYADEVPVLIDAGVGTYTRQTFSSERYTIWTMQSNYHNLPLINGQAQVYGAKYRAADVLFNAGKKQFSLDISGAYGEEAAVKKWVRTYTLSEKGLRIEDQAALTATKDTTVFYFMTWAEPDISDPGKVVLKKENTSITLQYDAALLTALAEVVPQTDTRLSNVWGDKLYRLALRVKKPALKSRYVFTITK
ncbi:MAG TPA: heparinase II/III family protein [Chitinophagaceae bacterium]|nr:heparinase II/III family protein [Chitinophagaceae bacterium]